MIAEQAWQAAIGQLQMEMSKASYDTWVKPAELIKYEGGVFVVGVPNAYACDWLKSRLSGTVSKILTGLMQSPQQVEFVIWHKDYENQVVVEEQTSAPLPLISEPHPTAPVVNSRYNFDNFVVGGLKQAGTCRLHGSR
jgi:chromosomal replication initiator protein